MTACSAACSARRAAINPGDTTSLSANLTPGRYTVSVVVGGGIVPARIDVGAPRPSGQDRLMQP